LWLSLRGCRSLRAACESACFALCSCLSCALTVPVFSSPMASVVGLVPGRRCGGKKDLVSVACPFVETQVGGGEISSLSQPSRPAATRELDLISFIFCTSCHSVGSAVPIWLLWRLCVLCPPFRCPSPIPLLSATLYLELWEKMMGLLARSPLVALDPSLSLFRWISTWQSDINTGPAPRHRVLSILGGSLRFIYHGFERNMRLTAFNQPRKLGDCNHGTWNHFGTCGAALEDPFILKGPSRIDTRVGHPCP